MIAISNSINTTYYAVRVEVLHTVQYSINVRGNVIEVFHEIKTD